MSIQVVIATLSTKKVRTDVPGGIWGPTTSARYFLAERILSDMSRLTSELWCLWEMFIVVARWFVDVVIAACDNWYDGSENFNASLEKNSIGRYSYHLVPFVPRAPTAQHVKFFRFSVASNIASTGLKWPFRLLRVDNALCTYVPGIKWPKWIEFHIFVRGVMSNVIAQIPNDKW